LDNTKDDELLTGDLFAAATNWDGIDDDIVLLELAT